MNKIRFYFILSFITLTLFSCRKNDDDAGVITPPRDYAEQYASDIDSIEGYLKTHYIKQVTTVDGLPDVIIDSIPKGNPGGLISIWENTEYPLQHKIVKNDSRNTNLVDGRLEDPVDYKLYYLVINEGGKDRPTTVDSTYTTYRGWKLDDEQFDDGSFPLWSTFPVLSAGEASYISGYRQFLPMLKSATKANLNDDGTVSYENLGIGVVFIPSGLGYFNVFRDKIPVYSPLVFVIRLHSVKQRDHDRDGILTTYEDLNGDLDFYNDDTDGDNAPDFLDIDDDDDNFLTKNEIKMPGSNTYYPFDQIPFCSGGTVKRHLDKNCHN